ncbi:MAG TPA: neocarzinostatin apoprotein domain-containing protein, partial [Acidimicrobiales bacterium]|nr:neocarzinostatin apoprotein domain-containing protein [Acidimicrobiales bacterium]
TFDPSAPLAPPPALTVDPDTGLVRHQTVAVTGSGFRAEEPYFLMQCLATEPPWGGCAGVERVDTEPTGDLVTTYRVRVIVGGDGLPRGDCRVDPCDLVVTQSEQPEDPPEARVPLEFASAATEPVPAAPASAAPAVPAFTG